MCIRLRVRVRPGRLRQLLRPAEPLGAQLVFTAVHSDAHKPRLFRICPRQRTVFACGLQKSLLRHVLGQMIIFEIHAAHAHHAVAVFPRQPQQHGVLFRVLHPAFPLSIYKTHRPGQT